MAGPLTVFADGSQLVLTSWAVNAVQVWDLRTETVLEDHRDFQVPINAIRFQGDLVVAELGTSRVVRARGDDPSVREVLAEGLRVPAGLAATEDDLWVGDWAAGIVWQVVADGETLVDPVLVARDLASPEGLALGPEENLLAVETGTDCLLSIDLETGRVSTVAEGLEAGAQGPPNCPPTWLFSGVAVGRSGTIYVAGDRGGIVTAIIPAAEVSPPETNAGRAAWQNWAYLLALGGAALLGLALRLRRFFKARG